MDGSALLVLTITITFLFLLVQRSERKYRRWVFMVLFFTAGLLLRHYAMVRGVEAEAWAALGIALVLNFLFWILIGRYNPVGSSDSIQVLGMDD